MRIWIILGVILTVLAGQGAAEDPRPTVTVAMRTDAPPFVWQKGEGAGYDGFFYDICKEAVFRAGFRVDPIVAVNAIQRSAFLSCGSFPEEASQVKPSDDGALICQQWSNTADLLCDPTTITLERMKHFNKADGPHFRFSPILYVANGSYVEQPMDRLAYRERLRALMTDACKDPKQAKGLGTTLCPADPIAEERVGAQLKRPFRWIAFVNQPTAEGEDPALQAEVSGKCGLICQFLAEPASGTNLATECAAVVAAMKSAQKTDWKATVPEIKRWPPQMWPKAPPENSEVQIWGYVAGSTIGQEIERAAKLIPSKIKVCAVPLASHREAAKAFCDGILFRYFGDVDLVRAALQNQRKDNPDRTYCPADEGQADKGTYEPYALVLNAKGTYPDFPERFSAALYSMFRDDTVQDLFPDHFKDRQPSEYLQVLFELNKVPQGLPVNFEPLPPDGIPGKEDLLSQKQPSESGAVIQQTTKKH